MTQLHVSVAKCPRFENVAESNRRAYNAHDWRPSWWTVPPTRCRIGLSRVERSDVSPGFAVWCRDWRRGE